MLGKLYFLILFALLISIQVSTPNITYSLDMDVKCAVYQHSDEENGDNVDVRILVMGLNNNTNYTAEVIPDHNPPITAITKTDPEGIFWIVVKILNGEHSLLFWVNVYEGMGTDGKLVRTGDDDIPCATIFKLPEQE